MTNTITAPAASTDSRFFEGWTWIFEHKSEPNIGLCYRGTPDEAAAEYFKRNFTYWKKQSHCFSLTGPDAEPVRHSVERA